jgi:hypothetical protein
VPADGRAGGPVGMKLWGRLWSEGRPGAVADAVQSVNRGWWRQWRAANVGAGGVCVRGGWDERRAAVQ